MADKKFSRSQLFAIRNNIAVDMLIKDVLNVPCKSRQGRFCFLCPLCRQFNTGVNYKTNLARCFDCEKNFNTIDLVMVIRQVGFVDSVRFLKKLHDCRLSGPVGSGGNIAGNLQTNHTGSIKPACPVPVHVGNVIKDIIKPMTSGETKRQPPDIRHNLAGDFGERILELEQKMEALAYQFNKITKLINRLFPCL
jgi:hypothetical protein